MKQIRQLLNGLSSLKIAILLLLLIAISCALGTIIPQQESDQFYYDNFNKNPFLGIINANILSIRRPRGRFVLFPYLAPRVGAAT